MQEQPAGEPARAIPLRIACDACGAKAAKSGRSGRIRERDTLNGQSCWQGRAAHTIAESTNKNGDKRKRSAADAPFGARRSVIKMAIVALQPKRPTAINGCPDGRR
ncbi:hypothetical protein [Rhizobium rhizosphaerae]|uniref:hypothetical protein n=1 Tax=Xaviernesmea rhizosphaerae TaxID=1672749 RepID=UPI00117B5B10|nr:hypothetical protein [Xaviernesmea rhizosphaerae]